MLRTLFYFFFFNDTATTEIYTLSLHDALPIFKVLLENLLRFEDGRTVSADDIRAVAEWLKERSSTREIRSEEHTSELQSRQIPKAAFCLKKKTNIHNSISESGNTRNTYKHSQQ